MKKKELLTIFQVLNQMGNLTGSKFAYGVSKNIGILKNDAEAIEKAINASKDYQEYQNKRLELGKKLCDKYTQDTTIIENGSPVVKKAGEDIIENGGFKMVENKDKFEKEFIKLQKDYKSAIDEMDKFLDEEVTVQNYPYKIKLEDLPKDMNVRMMHAISELINAE